ncbi:MAG: RtcB family protein [Mariniphaga sp.]|nr:RtcB family protein [Mariniphaga sp.]
MKKLKLRGKELKRIGYSNDREIAQALNITNKYLKKKNKVEVLEMLEKVKLSPESFLKHNYFRELAELLLGVNPNKKEKIRLRKKAYEFKIFGEEYIDPEAIHQMETAMKLPIAVKGALMPDAHVGYGLPIGGVLATYNAVIPYGVGMDIGCRMCMSVFPLKPEIITTQSNRIKNILIENTRFGLAEFKDLESYEILERPEFKDISFLRSLKGKFARQLGTSGHGNHFVDAGIFELKEKQPEIDFEPGNYFAILTHSGSRNFGAEIAKHYTRIAQQKLGLQGEASKLAWLGLDSEEGREYWKAMELAGDYSALNHRIVHEKLAKALGKKPLQIFENHHNFAWKEKLSDSEELIIHRKGATPAGIGDIGIIPGTMASPAFLVAGKGNEESLNSASHGAGRLMSRNKAKSIFTQTEINRVLDKNGVKLMGGGLDEAPMAYKNIEHVMLAQDDLVRPLAKFYPKIVRME